MTLTVDASVTIQARIQRDPAFASALLDEAIAVFLNGEPDVARLVLRDLVNGTIGFEGLAAATGRPSKSLHRMLSAKGNPTMDSLTMIFGALRQALGVEIRVQTVACV
jgi:DNA-binding phage protein